MWKVFVELALAKLDLLILKYLVFNVALIFMLTVFLCILKPPFWGDSCFYRTCLNELPFSNEPFIDYNFKMSKGFSIAHLTFEVCITNLTMLEFY